MVVRPPTSTLTDTLFPYTALFRSLSLPFIGQMPTLADVNLGIEAKSTQYGILYASFGVGALAGALSIGTVLAGRSLARVVRVGLVVFALFLAVFAVLRQPRSEERRVGKGCVRTCRSRGSPYH